jgi:hypothetical protein
MSAACGNVSGIFSPGNGSGGGSASPSAFTVSSSDATIAKNWETIPEDAIWIPVITVPATVPKRTAERTIQAVFFNKLFFLIYDLFSFQKEIPQKRNSPCFHEISFLNFGVIF